MRLFTINEYGKFAKFKEQDFKKENKEVDLEVLLEDNPEYFFESSKIAIIGRQVTTNLNTFIDLLGIDKYGDTVVIELKRGKTPRETIAQLIEYASFIQDLDYNQLNEIYRNYSSEELSLEEYHQEYFKNGGEEQPVSFNKSIKLVIVAQNITPEIKQTSLYLRKKGIQIYCLEFKYFINKGKEKIISSDFVVGDEEFIKQKLKSSSQLPKIDKETFLKSLDENGLNIFKELFKFAEREGLLLRWGSKGFSLNLELGNEFVGLCFGYPPNSVFKQSIYSGFEEITKKVSDPEDIIESYKNKLKGLNIFKPAKSNLKWIIEKQYTNGEINKFIEILKKIISEIKDNGLKT